MRFTRRELAGVLATRHGHDEGVGTLSSLDLRIRVTPELLEGIMRGQFVNEKGEHSRLDAIEIDDAGYAVPVMERIP